VIEKRAPTGSLRALLLPDIAVVVAIAGSPLPAAAQWNEPPPASSPPPVSVAAPVDEAPAFRRWVVTTELLGTLTGRYGGQLEYVLTERDSIAVYGFYLTAETEGTKGFLEGDPSYTYDTQTRAGGADLQYRRYFAGGKGATGVFIAPGLEVHSYVKRRARARPRTATTIPDRRAARRNLRHITKHSRTLADRSTSAGKAFSPPASSSADRSASTIERSSEEASTTSTGRGTGRSRTAPVCVLVFASGSAGPFETTLLGRP
jgi:hypothetical protein